MPSALILKGIEQAGSNPSASAASAYRWQLLVSVDARPASQNELRPAGHGLGLEWLERPGVQGATGVRGRLRGVSGSE